MSFPGDYFPAKIRELTPGLALSDAGIELGTGAAPGASKTVPAALAEVAARSYLLSRSTAAPPASPAEFDRYYVPAGATGAWASLDGLIAEWLLLPNNLGASTGAWYFTAARGVNYVEDEAVIIAFGGAGPVPGPVLQKLVTKTGNYAVTAADAIIRFDATAGALVCTVNRNLGTAGTVRQFSIERAVTDATANPITVIDDAGTELGAILSPVNGGMVPFLTAYADGTHVTVKGVP